MIGRSTLWALFGPPGLREVIVVVVVAFILYGRSGVARGLQRTPYGRVLGPWINAATPGTGTGAAATRAKPRRKRWGDRWFWLLAATAVTAVAAWVVTRLLIAAPGMSH